jgi:putative addiction module component (TIGR02574 family)
MSTVADAEQAALRLSDSERARLAEKLIASLPSPFVNDDDGIEESVRRSREMDEDPEMALTHEQFMASFKKYRRQ